MDEKRRELLTWLGIGGGVAIGGVGVGVSAFGGSGNTNAQPQPNGDDGSTPTETVTQTQQEPDVRHASEFGTVVHALDAGVDPEGNESINPFLEEYASDDTLLSFPEGTYRLEPVDFRDYTHLGISAAGETRPTFVGADGHCLRGGTSFVRFDNVEDLLLDGVHFDFDAEGVGGALRVNAVGDVTIRDVSASGGCEPQVVLLRIDVLDADSTGTVENLQLDNRATDIGLTGIFVGEPHAGELIFRECEVTGFTDNGLYASAPGLPDGMGGTVIVEGGTYRNNNIANVRLGTEGSVARGVKSISDGLDTYTGTSPSANARGFRFRNGKNQLIENCEVRISANSRDTFGGILFHQSNGGATVRNTTFEIDRDETPAIRTFPNEHEQPETTLFENVTITGNASNGEAVFLEGRDRTVFRNCTIVGSGEERNGIYIQDSADCHIVDTRIDVTRNPLVLRESTVLIENSTIVTPDETRVIHHMEASDEDFTPRGEI